ncbi:MAG: methyltransferase domain-containing protein [Chloroflexi bacterium]|nr:methyltransferase domain-containing protein [Chloroflexota bacterium]
MELAAYYDAYWRQADDTFDHERLELLAKHVGPGDRVLEVDCGPGVLAAKMRDKGAEVMATDLSQVAVERARAKGIECVRVDLDSEPLPFPDNSFRVVVSNSAIEHRFFYEKHLDECVRVLEPGGKFIVCLPNIAHLICRWWILTGRFPYVPDGPTDLMHLRFFTVREVRRLCAQRGLKIVSVEGSASLWAREFYPPLWRKHRLRPLMNWLARVWPAMFGRDFVLVGLKSSSPQHRPGDGNEP